MMLPLLLAALVAVPAATAPPVNLPRPAHTCRAVIAGIGAPRHRPLNADTLGLMYASALRLNGVRGTGTKISYVQLLQAQSDVLGCFVRGS